MDKKVKAFQLKKGKNIAPFYKVNPQIRKNVPYDKLYEDGVFVCGNSCSVMYECFLKEKELELLQALRQSDVTYRIYEDREHQYLMLYEDKEYEEFLLYSTRIVELMSSFCDIKQLNLNERFRLLHNNCRIETAEKGDLQFGDYLSNYRDWESSFSLNQYDFFPKDIKEEIEGEDGQMILMGIGALPKNTNKSRELLGDMKDHGNCKLFVRIYESIEDQAVFRNIKSRFMGIESSLVKIRNEQPDFYAAFTNPTSDNQRMYFFTGAIMLLGISKSENIKEVIEDVENRARQLGGNVFVFAADKEKIFKNLIGLRLDPGFTRIEQTKNLRKTIPFVQITKKDDSEWLQKYML